jgi:hypothetical protein
MVLVLVVLFHGWALLDPTTWRDHNLVLSPPYHTVVSHRVMSCLARRATPPASHPSTLCPHPPVSVSLPRRSLVPLRRLIGLLSCRTAPLASHCRHAGIASVSPCHITSSICITIHEFCMSFFMNSCCLCHVWSVKFIFFRNKKYNKKGIRDTMEN